MTVEVGAWFQIGRRSQTAAGGGLVVGAEPAGGAALFPLVRFLKGSLFPEFSEKMRAMPQTGKSIHVTFGAASSSVETKPSRITLHLAMPWLAGPKEECILSLSDGDIRESESFSLLENSEYVAGVAILDSTRSLQEESQAIYRSLLKCCEGFHLYRCWNYVPTINVVEDHLERYRQFNAGRWLAFNEAFGQQMSTRLCAASAVGCCGDRVVVAFLAGKHTVQHLENPHQTPAHRYPLQYGPKAPAFARASLLNNPESRTAWLSGTASIRGSDSLGTGNLKEQLAVTWENIRTMQEVITQTWRVADAKPRTFKVYLRHPENYIPTRDFLQNQGVDLNSAIFLHSDICRSELDVEIEGVFEQQNQLLIPMSQ